MERPQQKSPALPLTVLPRLVLATPPSPVILSELLPIGREELSPLLSLLLLVLGRTGTFSRQSAGPGLQSTLQMVAERLYRCRPSLRTAAVPSSLPPGPGGLSHRFARGLKRTRKACREADSCEERSNCVCLDS